MRMQALLASTILCFSTFANARDIDLGTVELSGSGSFSLESRGRTDEYSLIFAPEVGIYLAPFFYLGPVSVYQSTIWRRESEGSFPSTTSTVRSQLVYRDFGGKLGFLINYSQNLLRPLPYFAFSGGISLARSESSGGFESTAHGPFLSPAVGMKMKISESFLLNLEQNFTHRDVFDQDENTFALRFGFSGFF